MPWDQGPGLRCPGALVPGFPSKVNTLPQSDKYKRRKKESPKGRDN
jgi:hypothetical protein